MNKRTIVLALAALMAVLYLLLALLDFDRIGDAAFLALILLLASLHAGLLYRARKLSLFGMDRRSLLILALLALAVRLVMTVGTDGPEVLTRDVSSFMHQGELICSGANPYEIPPTADHLERPYPPLSQFLFAAAFILHGHTVYGLKVLCFLFELVTLLGLVILISDQIVRRPFQSWIILVWAFSPVVLLAFFLSAHGEIFALPFLVFGLIQLKYNRPWASGMLFGLAAMADMTALLFAPVALFHLLGSDRWRFAVAWLGTAVALLVPFVIGDGWQIVTCMLVPFSEPVFNASAFAGLETLFGTVPARWLAAALTTGVVIAMVLWRNRIEGVTLRMLIIATAYVILTPSAPPWHVVWLLPFALINRHLPSLLLSGTILLSYWAPLSGAADTTWWLRIIQYAPYYLLLLLPLFRNRAAPARRPLFPGQ